MENRHGGGESSSKYVKQHPGKSSKEGVRKGCIGGFSKNSGNSTASFP